MFVYLCSILPNNFYSLTYDHSYVIEIPVVLSSIRANGTLTVFIPANEELGILEKFIDLPNSFGTHAACIAALRMPKESLMTVRLVCMRKPPYTPMYLRMYINSIEMVKETKMWGTLRHIAAWDDFLKCTFGPFRESIATLPFSNAANSDKDLHRLMATFETTSSLKNKSDDVNQLSLHPYLGTMRFASEKDEEAEDFDEGPPPRLIHAKSSVIAPPPHSTSKAVGVIRTCVLDAVSITTVLTSLSRLKNSSTNDNICSYLGQGYVSIKCSLIIVTDSVAAKLTPRLGVIIVRTAEAARALSFANICASFAVVLSDAVSLIDLVDYEKTTVETFAHAASRGLLHDAHVPLTFNYLDKTRFFTARAPISKNSNWCVPLSLYKWERVLLSLSQVRENMNQHPTRWKSPEVGAIINACKTWVLQEDEHAAVPHSGPSYDAACAAANVLGLQKPSTACVNMYATIVNSSIVLRAPLRGSTIFETCVAQVDALETDIRSRCATLLPKNNLESQNDADQNFRLALGAFPSALMFEKMKAAVHGASANNLALLLKRFAVGPQAAFALEVLIGMQRGSRGDCSVCMCEPGDVMTVCGHVYCRECVDVITRPTPLSAIEGFKCSVCRTVNYVDDWWRVRADGNEVPPPSLLQELARILSSTTTILSSVRTLVILPSRKMAKTFSDAFFLTLSTLQGDQPFTICALSDVTEEILHECGVLVLIGTSLPCEVDDGNVFIAWNQGLSRIIQSAAKRGTCAFRIIDLVDTICAGGPDDNPPRLCSELRDQYFSEPVRRPRYDLRTRRETNLFL
jgi:hypothetical protein